MPPRVVGV